LSKPKLEKVPSPPDTPMGKVLFVLGISIFLVFLVLFIVVQHRTKVLNEAFSQMEDKGDKVFSVLKEHFVKYQKSKRQDIYTYNIPDETGAILEVSEAVDSNTHNRLRVGDTVECYRRVIQVSGKRTVISRIKGNIEAHTNYIYLQNMSVFGMSFSGILLFLSFILFILGK
jgi:hypothetical protein